MLGCFGISTMGNPGALKGTCRCLLPKAWHSVDAICIPQEEGRTENPMDGKHRVSSATQDRQHLWTA